MWKYLLLLLLCIPLAGCSASGKSGSNQQSKLELQYDDRYKIEQGAVTVSDNSIVSWNESDRTLQAVGVGSTVVSIDGVDTDVVVSKAKLNVILISGQSNANGIHGALAAGTTPICPDYGYGYYWNTTDTAGEWDDLKTSVERAIAADSKHSIGFHPALAQEWYLLTGEKTAVIKDAYPGDPISNWVNKDGTLNSNTTKSLAAIEKAIGGIDTEKFEIVRTGYYWLQGETDTFIYPHEQAVQYYLPQDYVDIYLILHKAYIEALTLPNVPAPVGGILATRTMDYLVRPFTNIELCSPRVGHQSAANITSDLYMASVVTDSWYKNEEVNFTSLKGVSVSGTTITFGANDIHYSQQGYDLLGLDAADNMYQALVEQPALSDFEVIGHNGYTKYQAGDTIDVSKNLRPIGTYNACDKGMAQILVRPLPISANTKEVKLIVKDKDGNEVSGVIDSNGYINADKVTGEFTLVVSVDDVQKEFKLVNP